MATILTTTGGLVNEAKTTYDQILLRRAKPKLVYNLFGVKASIPERGGVNIEWRRVESFPAATTALTEGTISTETAPTVSKVVATISQYGQFFRSTDLVETQAFDPLIAEFSEALGESMGNTLDQLTRTKIITGSNVQFASTAGSLGGVGSGMRMNSTEIRKALANLETNNAYPINGVYPMIIHTYTKYDIFADSNVQNAFLYAWNRGTDNPLATGQLGNYLGAEFYVTSNGAVGTSLGLSGANVYYSMLIGDGAYGVVDLTAQQARIYFKPRGSGGATGDPIDQLWSLGWKAAHAAAILNDNFLLRIDHTASLDPAYGS